MVCNKNIVVGITGGIAAYKVIDVCRKLVEKNNKVNVIMTKNAQKFLKPLTLQTITNNPVATDMFTGTNNWEVEHISLADRANLFLIAPATANFIGKIANGIADDLLTTTIMATNSKVVIAPSMNVKMYDNSINQMNLNRLRDLSYHIIEPEKGFLACGYEGKGRLPSTETILSELEFAITKKDLIGKRIIVTAGPTIESIDPVRYISNYSSGKMGYAIATAAINRGAQVTLISGPTNLKTPKCSKYISVKSAKNMRDAVLDYYEDSDVVIMSAAVADYKPLKEEDEKIKKNNNENLRIELTKNPDILFELGQKKSNQILVGFAAESNDLILNANKKIKNKNLDVIIANDITQDGAGFNSDTNIAKIIDKNGNIDKIKKIDKTKLAHIVLDKISSIRT